MRRPILTGLVAGLFIVAASPVAAAGPWELEDVVGQGPAGPVVAVDAAGILRGANGISARVSMPTPAPGSYVYPTGATASGVAGHPEAFSLWVFIFYNPGACVGPCDGPDLMSPDPAIVAGAYNGGGHIEGGPNLTLAGHVNHQSTVFGGPNAESLATALSQGFDLANAEVHLAVAPHGALDPSLLPASISTPAGNPPTPANFWWLAFFSPAP
jgi:hypothetical protein